MLQITKKTKSNLLSERLNKKRVKWM